MEQIVFDDFWRTKENLIEIIATAIYNDLKGLQRKYDIEAKEKMDASFTNEVINPEKSEFNWGTLGDSERIFEKLADLSFSGYDYPTVLKEFYKNNLENDMGKYFEPLVSIMAALNGKKIEISENDITVEYEVEKMNPFKKFFLSKGDTYIIKVKHIAPLLNDLINCFKKIDKSNEFCVGWSTLGFLDFKYDKSKIYDFNETITVTGSNNINKEIDIKRLKLAQIVFYKR